MVQIAAVKIRNGKEPDGLRLFSVPTNATSAASPVRNPLLDVYDKAEKNAYRPCVRRIYRGPWRSLSQPGTILPTDIAILRSDISRYGGISLPLALARAMKKLDTLEVVATDYRNTRVTDLEIWWKSSGSTA